MKFDEQLNEYINTLNILSKELSIKSNLSASIISKYRKGERKPKIDSPQFQNLVSGLYILAHEKNINLNKEDISNSLKKSIEPHYIDFEIFRRNFNYLVSKLDINLSTLAGNINYDSSFISRIKNGKRKPSDLDSFIEKLVDYIVNSYQTQKKLNIIKNILNCSDLDLSDTNTLKSKLSKWISNNNFLESNNNSMLFFFNKLDNFNLNEYIGTDLNKIKIPTSPIIFKNSKMFYGIDGRKKAVGEFLKTTLISKSKEPIFFYTNLPITVSSNDTDFKKKWMLLVAMILKKGLHINSIHNINRPLNEMLLGIECWLPLYMSGAITPYYFDNFKNNNFEFSLFTSGDITLSSEGFDNNEINSRFYLSTKKEDLLFEKEKANYLLKKAKPLMKIYKEKDKKEFDEFLNNNKSDKLKKIKPRTLNNIEITVNENKWIIVSKTKFPTINFVIYNKKLIQVLYQFINNLNNENK